MYVQSNTEVFLISNFRRVLYVVCFLLGDSPASEFYKPTFRIIRIIHLLAYEDGTDSVPKRRLIKFRGRGITQKKNIQHNTEVLSCNHSSNGKATSITYSVCVSVALDIQSVKRMRPIAICGLFGYTTFSHIIS
jgi:hypothetical protein